MKTTLSRKGLWKGIAKQFWGIIKLPIWIQQRLLIRLLCWIPFCCLSQCEVTRHCFPPPAALRTSPSTALGRLTLQELLPLLQSVYSRFEKGDCKPQQQKEKRGKAKQWLQIKQWQQSHEGRAGECLSHEECPKTGYRSGGWSSRIPWDAQNKCPVCGTVGPTPPMQRLRDSPSI